MWTPALGCFLEKIMKNRFVLGISILILITLTSCTSMPITSRDRLLSLNGYTISETNFGGIERQYAVDKYNYDSLVDEVRFQVGYFRENNIGFVLYGNGTTGEEAYFSRQGLDLRWDWGSYYRDGSIRYRYSFVIEPDGTGLYYDFSTSTDGVSKPRGIYKVHKFQ